MKLFLLYHKRWIDNSFYDTKIIGVYSSHRKALDTINRYSHLTGFNEYKKDFYIDTFDVLKKGVVKKGYVYLLIGVSYVDFDEIVVYYSAHTHKFSALWTSLIKIIKRNKQPIENFYIDKYEIDEDNWKEGFVILDN